MRTVLSVAVLALAPLPAVAGPRVDLNQDVARRDVLSPGWDNWRVPAAADATARFGEIAVTLRAVGPGAKLGTGWWKPGFDHPARMASDGVVVHGGLELVLRGLAPGRHSLATYHNALSDAKPGRITVAVRGGASVTVTPTKQVTHDADAASAYVECEAAAGKDVVISLTPEGSGGVVLNGFEIDRSDPARRAAKPVPADGDEHAPEAPVLEWRPAAGATAHHVYLGTDGASVAKAAPGSAEWRGERRGPTFPTAPLKLNSRDTYFWRVDEVHPGGVVRGEVWRFRARHLAFPGAEGYGRFARGGRGGKVYVVTSLADAGPGTFRAACNAVGPRVVVFNVAGTIRLKNRVRIRAPYITIAGQTAPGDGVCVRGATVCVDTHDVVIRHLRFRRGETDVANRDDALGGNPVGNVILDHVSASWGLDENLSLYRHMYRPPGGGKELKLPTVNITVQWCISSEALDTYNHSFGSTLGGHNSTFHHNLWACNTGRNPSVGMDGDFNFLNNVLFNWRHRTVDGGDQNSRYNVLNNYYKPGPATPEGAIRRRVLRPDGRRPRGKTSPREWGKAYVAGNVIEGDKAVTEDNWAGGVQIDGDADPAVVLPRVRADRPFPMAKAPLQSARAAYEAVLEHAGATRPRRDAVDRRVIDQVRRGTVSYAAGKGIIKDVSQVGGYPEYRGEPRKDSDGDGMPDEWERKYGLNPHDPSDAAGDCNGDGYTNFEKYLNGLSPRKKVDWKALSNNRDPLMTAR